MDKHKIYMVLANLGCEYSEANESNRKMIAYFPICFGQYVVAAAAAMYQEHVLNYKHLDEPLDEGTGLSLNVFWQGPSKPLSHVVDLFHVPRHSVV